MNIGERIKELRKANHMTQHTLGNNIGVDGNTVSRWEKNKLGVASKYITRLASELHTTTDYILTGTESTVNNIESDTPQITNNTVKEKEEILTENNDRAFIKQGDLIGSGRVLYYHGENGSQFVIPATEENQAWFRDIMSKIIIHSFPATRASVKKV